MQPPIKSRFNIFLRRHKTTIFLLFGALLFYGVILPLIPSHSESLTLGQQMLSGIGAVILCALIIGFAYWKDGRRKKKMNQPAHPAPDGKSVSSKWTLWSKIKNLF